MRAVPKSGCVITNNTGTIVMIRGIIRVLIKLLSLFIEWKYLARAKINVYLTNSEGCRLIPAILIHRVAPLLSIPKKGMMTKDIMLRKKITYA